MIASPSRNLPFLVLSTIFFADCSRFDFNLRRMYFLKKNEVHEIGRNYLLPTIKSLISPVHRLYNTLVPTGAHRDVIETSSQVGMLKQTSRGRLPHGSIMYARCALTFDSVRMFVGFGITFTLKELPIT